MLFAPEVFVLAPFEPALEPVFFAPAVFVLQPELVLPARLREPELFAPEGQIIAPEAVFVRLAEVFARSGAVLAYRLLFH